MVEHGRLADISAALDGEGPMPPDLTADEQRYVDAGLRLRATLRISEAEVPPDVTGAVLDRLATGRRPPRRRLLLAVAAAFVVAAVAGALAVRPGGPVAPRPVAAGLAERVIEGQRAVTGLDADVRVVEHRPHPDVSRRTLAGTLRYEAPERFQLSLRETGTVPAGWPRHDVELSIGDGRADLDSLAGCPVAAQPGCLHRERRSVTDLPPFSPTWVSPLDLVIPADAFLPAVPTDVSSGRRTVAVETTVARIDRLVEGVTSAGAIRGVHATDVVRLELDEESLVLRRLHISAADNLARSTWAATNGYDDRPGAVVLELELDPRPAGSTAWTAQPIGTDGRSAGFRDVPLDPAWPAPPGFRLHRTGILQDGGPSTEVYAYSDGRAWIRVDLTTEWDEPRLFGSLGTVVRPVDVGSGTGYTDPGGTRLSLHTRDRDVLVTGSVDLDVLVAAAAEVVTGEPVPEGWSQAQRPAQIPEGALVPDGEHVAVLNGGELVIAVGGPGSTGIVLVQAPAAALDPPLKGDVVETPVRGVAGRYSARLGTLTWLEDGWRRELRGAGLDLAELRSVAQDLRRP